MERKRFREPRVKIDRVYTRGGDAGETSLAGGQRVPKDGLRLEAYGTVDELNSAIGLAVVSARELTAAQAQLATLVASLTRIQHELCNLGAALAMPAAAASDPQHPAVTAREVACLEAEMDAQMARLPTLRSFVLPGGSRLSTELHLARTICRRAERHCVALARVEGGDPQAVRYLNRLSDALFVFGRWADQVQDKSEVLWNPNDAASGAVDPNDKGDTL